ncbi:Retrovirus-related Pol polyprotein from transposon 297 [Araneus ventricosus]|uniref:Retrovirus-related Pol polyprotein from transposon 297 n=1 Tax=Araneus ventricosus TaxID=182803 RepID=A0A4Y2PWL6_ARAVE|nr:Retrovirus-related Pol polyprotein from transposon 297 [Araneus ventricosus]
MIYLLEKFDSIFKPGGDPTSYAEHHINTEKHPPVSVPPYRMTPMKKELLRKEIEDLLEKDVIEGCESVFLKLKDYKLRANRSKCHFACSRVKYLGLWITLRGIEIDPDKKLLALRVTLQRKKTVWTWTESEQNAFTTLKNCLVSPPILSHADFTKPFVLRTDASSHALGAVLLHGADMEEHTIEYASRLLNFAERNYSAKEREALAVVWAMNKFRGYIEGSKITVASDHQPLKWLMKLKSPSGRLARWALQLQSFDLNLEYIPGKSNVIADMLSRLDYDQEIPSCEENTVSIDFPARSPMEIREEQLKDTFVPEITPYLKIFSKFMAEAKEVAEMQQDLRKECGNKQRRRAPNYFPGDRVFVTTHHLSNAAKERTNKFMSKRDGPYIIFTQKSPTSCVIANPDNLNEPNLMKYHASALKVFKQDESEIPVHPLRKRGRPRKTFTSGSSPRRSGRRRSQRGSL